MDSSTKSLHARNSSSNMLKMSRAVSFPRQDQPEIPSNKADYHVTLIEEIGRVMRILLRLFMSISVTLVFPYQT